MPGTILVPVDSSDAVRADAADIVAEAKASGSKVLLLGIVPVHIYSRAEREELERITAKTTASVKMAGKMLVQEGIEAVEVIRSGYPDEEILRAAEKYEVSLIMLPSGGKAPSELTKAAAILIEEPERVRRPVYILNTATV